MPDINNIVAGIDFSPYSDAAARKAYELSRQLGCRLTLVHVGNVTSFVPEDGNSTAQECALVLKALTEEDRERLHKLRERLAPGDSKVSHILFDSPDPAEGLVSVAEQLNAQLIVVGTHGYPRVQRLLVGSTADKVVRLAQISVMVVKPNPAHGVGFARVLILSDLSKPAEAAIDVGAQLALPNASIDVLSFWQPPWRDRLTTPNESIDAFRRVYTSDLRQRGAQLLRQSRMSTRNASHKVEEGDPITGILKRRSAAANYDVVVVGSHGRRGWRRLLLGSTSSRMVRHAACTVVVARDAPGGPAAQGAHRQ